MKLLNIVKTEPNQSTSFLMEALSQGKEVTRFDLYENQDYDELVKLIFENEEVISWW